MFRKGLVDTLEQNMGGYTARATVLFFFLGISLCFSVSIWVTWMCIPRFIIFLAGLHGMTVLTGWSFIIKMLSWPALYVMYYIGFIGIYIVVGSSLFLSYIVFKRRTLVQEWDRCLALVILYCCGPALMRYWYIDDVSFFIAGGQWSMYVGEYIFTCFDELPGILFLQLMCVIFIILFSRCAIISSLIYFMTRVRSNVYCYLGNESVLANNAVLQKKSSDTVVTEILKSLSSDMTHEADLSNTTYENVDYLHIVDGVPLTVDTPYELPDGLLAETGIPVQVDPYEQLRIRASILEEKLTTFGIKGTVVSIKPGPVVTLFEYQPQIDSKISKIIALEDDLALALQALSIRIIAPIPGKAVVGFEVANKTRQKVLLSRSIQSSLFQQIDYVLPVVLGQDTMGNEVIIDVTRMPHLLIAGSTGSGKSVTLNSLLVSLLCKKNPKDMRLVLIDPKRLEFTAYTDIPHLLFPIVTDAKQVAPILRWMVKEMERRYSVLAEVGARNMFDYQVKRTSTDEHFPYLVIIIDEFADLMMLTGKEVDDLIGRITQMARAAGIHMIVATQRPSVDVITGTIKVNFPSRISFRVTSKVDSRTILDCGGAEKLLGSGDMLFFDSTSSLLKRVHGSFVSDEEIKQLVAHVRSQRKVSYQELGPDMEYGAMFDIYDQLYDDVKQYLQTVDEVSISLVQRRFRIGYNRSARIIEMLESDGLIMTYQGGKTRKVVR